MKIEPAQTSQYHCPETETLCSKCESHCEAAQPVQPAGAQGEAVVWVNSANLTSAAISQERGGPFEQHTWSESETAYHDMPLRAHQAPASAHQPAEVVRELTKAVQQMRLAIEWALEWDTERNFVMPYKVRDPMRAALKSAKEHGL